MKERIIITSYPVRFIVSSRKLRNWLAQTIKHARAVQWGE